MTSEYLRGEILGSIDFVESVLCIEAPSEILDCLVPGRCRLRGGKEKDNA